MPVFDLNQQAETARPLPITKADTARHDRHVSNGSKCDRHGMPSHRNFRRLFLLKKISFRLEIQIVAFFAAPQKFDCCYALKWVASGIWYT
jgi:hypothetical protein